MFLRDIAGSLENRKHNKLQGHGVPRRAGRDHQGDRVAPRSRQQIPVKRIVAELRMGSRCAGAANCGPRFTAVAPVAPAPGDRFLNGKHVGARFVPFAQCQAARGEETPDLRGIPAENFLEHGHEGAHGVVAKHGAARDAGDELRLGHGDGQAVMLVDVHHHGQVGTAIAHVDDAVGADAQEARTSSRAVIFPQPAVARTMDWTSRSLR